MTCKVHEGQSCLGGEPDQGWTIVFSRELTADEWEIVSKEADKTWYTSTIEYVGQPRICDWNPLNIIELLKSKLPDVQAEIEVAHRCYLRTQTKSLDPIQKGKTPWAT